MAGQAPHVTRRPERPPRRIGTRAAGSGRRVCVPDATGDDRSSGLFAAHELHTYADERDDDTDHAEDGARVSNGVGLHDEVVERADDDDEDAESDEDVAHAEPPVLRLSRVVRVNGTG